MDAARLADKEAKGRYVYQQLTAVARRTQPPIIAQLESLNVPYRQYWITNMIWVRGDQTDIEALALREDITHIYANPVVAMPPLPSEEPGIREVQAIEWNILKVNADDVWALGYTGQGIVIGGQDTGYDWDHVGLKTQYRGWNGSIASHDYNWHDAIHSGGGVCGADSPQPCDDHGHGTHTMGTMVGNDLLPTNPTWPAGAANAVGMAPGAEWVGCRNMNVGNGTPATYSECYEWFVAPYPIGGDPLTDGDPSKAPHVINNSWACPPSEGCTDPNVLLSVVQAVRAAGIVTAHSAGNSGNVCGSVNTPAAIYDESFTVGSTTSTDAISSFSSFGPVTVDGSSRPKPDITAPGSSIRSTTRYDTYGTSSGTSMAGPHVAGLVALVLSANPGLAGNVDVIEQIIQETAVPLTSSAGCGGDGPADVPNNVYGWGRIDALAAVQAALQYSPTPITLSVSKRADSMVMPGDLLTYTLTVTNNHPISATTGVVLSDTLPNYTSFYTATTPYQLNGDNVTWETAVLPGETAFQVLLVVRVNPDAPGDIVNADYGAGSAEAPFVNGPPVVTTLIPTNQLALSASAPPSVTAGNLLTYTIVVSNPHPFEAVHHLVLTSSIPAQTSFITATQPYTLTSVVQWQRAVLEAGNIWVVELGVLVGPEAAGTIVLNYGVQSEEVTAVAGTPVSTRVIRHLIYIPLVLAP